MTPQIAARRLFYPAAAFNFAAGLPFLVAPQAMARLIGMWPVPVDLPFVQAAIGAVLLFGVLYALVGTEPIRFRDFIWLGICGKAIFVVIFFGHFLAGNISWHLPGLVTLDAVWAVLFLRFLKTYSRS